MNKANFDIKVIWCKRFLMLSHFFNQSVPDIKNGMMTVPYGTLTSKSALFMCAKLKKQKFIFFY
jgi:hypothetical protein